MQCLDPAALCVMQVSGSALLWGMVPQSNLDKPKTRRQKGAGAVLKVPCHDLCIFPHFSQVSVLNFGFAPFRRLLGPEKAHRGCIQGA